MCLCMFKAEQILKLVINFDCRGSIFRDTQVTGWYAVYESGMKEDHAILISEDATMCIDPAFTNCFWKEV